MSARIIAAAHALCKLASEECGINEQDNWNVYSDMFKKDAKIALEAADAVADKKLAKRLKLETDETLVKLLNANKLLEDALKHYRETYGVIGTVQDKKTPDA